MADPKDVKVTGDVKVATPPPEAPPAPAPEAKKEDPKAAKPEDDKKNGSSFSVDTKSVYVAPEFSWNWRGFANSEYNSHSGPGFGITLGYPTLKFGDRFYLRIPEISYRKEWVGTDIPAEFGPGMKSHANIDVLNFLGFTFGVNVHRYFGIEAGARLGVAHIGSTASEDGKEGLRYYDNRFAYSVDNWSLNAEGRLAVGLPEQRVANWLQLGAKVFGGIGHNSWSFTPDSISRPPSDPAIGVSSLYGNVGLAVVGRFGEAPPPRKSETKEEPKAAPAPAPAAPAVPQGVKDVQALVEPLKLEVKKQLELKYADNAAGYAAQAAEKASSKKKDDHAIAQDTAKLAVEESKKGSTAYKAATETVTKAEAALAKLKEDKTLKPEHLKLAEEAVAAMKVEADKLKDESHKAWESATAAVKSYNSIKGVAKKDHIEFKDEDPAKAAALAKEEPKKEEPKKDDKPKAPAAPPKGTGIE